jgi:hypothetical protein
MKKGMKLREFTPVETEYEDAAAFPMKEAAQSYCKEMNGQSSGWTLEKVKVDGAEKWRVVWLGEQVSDTWERKIGNVTVVYSTEGTLGVGYVHGCECRMGESSTGTSTQTSGKRLRRDEIEKLPRLAEWVAQHT